MGENAVNLEAGEFVLFLPDYFRPKIKFYLLPGGFKPERMSKGAVGYDVRIRAVVSPTEMDKEEPCLRKTLFDFIHWPDDPNVTHHIQTKTYGEDTELIYRMQPLESVAVGIGFVCEMPFPVFQWVVPRSGLSSKYGISVTNAPGTVDPDYRGEACVVVYNRNNHCFDLSRGMRVAQVIYQVALIPQEEWVENYNDLSGTERGSGAFGSTGIN